MADTHQRETRQLYDAAASAWVRREPVSLSDYTARAPILRMCQPADGLSVLDLGCGEGYCARALRRAGAARVQGLDISPGMIAAARAEEEREPLGGLDYREGCATDLRDIPAEGVDLALAVFLFNYLAIAETRRVMLEVARVLRPGGRFLFAVPHPAYAFLRAPGPPFFFEVGDARYLDDRDGWFGGRIWRRDGAALEVRLCHKTVEDYFDALALAGFTTMPRVRELGVTPEMIALDPPFFGPLAGLPLHLCMEVRR